MHRELPERKKVEILSLEDAVRKYVHDGICLAFSGFTAVLRNPSAFGWEIARQGFKNLHVLDKHGSWDTALLFAAERISIYETDYVGLGEKAAAFDLCFERSYKEGKVMVEDYPHGGMAFRFLAGAIGIPFIPYYAALGSDIYNPAYDRLSKEKLRDGRNLRIPKMKNMPMTDPFYGNGTVQLLPAARPELAVIHVPQVGDKGTATWRGVDSLDKEMAFAADKVVLTCEEIVPEDKLKQFPEANKIPGFIVDCIVEVPWGAHPTAVPFYYDYDTPFLINMHEVSKSREAINEWLEEWVFSPGNWEEYITKLGVKKLMDLRADSVIGYSTRILRGKKMPPKVSVPLSVLRAGK